MPHTHLNLDDAWDPSAIAPAGEFQTLDVRPWAPRLRYHGTRRQVDAFCKLTKTGQSPFILSGKTKTGLSRFILFGSGDYHYLAGVFLRRITQPVTVVSFDNHPDWDIRPPYWACGGWVNRALEMPIVRSVCVWGCGNFELAMPSRLFANQRALRSKRLQIHAWAERQKPAVQRRFDCMTRENWRQRFEIWADSLAGEDLYVTVDLDCLCAEEAVTNWENGLYTAKDLAWALGRLREKSRIVAGDLCGAYSPPTYARWFQRLAGAWDHPRLPAVDLESARQINAAALRIIWPALASTAGDDH